MPALIQFVDSIGASPTVRLDVNDGAAWFCGNFSAPPPRLRRSESSNAMRDGGVVSSASYENRTLTLDLTLINTSTEDAAATEMQKLWRELDRPDNYLRYQREGMTKPVFFRLFRSDAADLEELWTVPIARNITIELLAEPFALGLRETGSVAINNDPAAGSNGLYADVSNILGDVAVRSVMWWTDVTNQCTLAVTHTGSTPAALLWSQAESLTLLTDTTNPGGGPDAAMSGAGTNNYVTTSFATATMQDRMSWSVPRNGTFRVYGLIRRSDALSVISARTRLVVGGGSAYGPKVATRFSASRAVVDLGTITLEGTSAFGRVGIGSQNAVTNRIMYIQAERSSGSGSLSWDFLWLVPVSEVPDSRGDASLAIISVSNAPVIVDGVRERVSIWSGTGDPLAGTATLGATSSSSGGSLVGSFPTLTPGSVNRIHALHQGNLGVASKSLVLTVNYAYWPAYLFVRPVST